ncbi:hypothetical protein [Planctomyces sp. SH-PL14]|uniref:hypothetical protein n=1 Tax=Planctomyces sp. SH-PL14 TaxID=1632864 RepID=UPI00078DE273|nr:hypothetical protein [Planctomyces sp. SH-PL14]AMV17418.1 hypothetical protein VT03_05970 [Planctomyces sp. SH-PL14]
MKADILADMRAGVVPRSVKHFSELHDYVAANCYGGIEALLDELDADVPDTDEGHSSAMTALCDLMNPAMDLVTEWLGSGGAMRDSVSRRSR